MRFIFSILAVTLWMTAFADEGTTLDYLTVGVGVRPAGMGNAFVGVSDDANAVHWNPGGLIFMSSPEIGYMHTELPAGTDYDYLTVATPVKFKQGRIMIVSREILPLGISESYRHYFGVSFVRVATDFQITSVGDTEPGTNYPSIVYYGTGKFSTMYYNFAYAYRWKNFGIGLGLKILDMDLYRHSGQGYGLNVGLMYVAKIMKFPVSLGLTVRDIGCTPIRWSTGYTEYVATTVEPGFAIKLLPRENEFSSGVTLAFSCEQVLPVGYVKTWHRPKFHAGLEWSIYNVVPVRFGYDAGHFTCGLGIRAEKIEINYAFSAQPELKNTHRIGISLRM